MNARRTAPILFAAALSLAGTALAADADDSAHMRINYDQSTVLHLDRPAKTVIVGNPVIADVQLINERTVYILGRMFGNTNIIAIDADGSEFLNTLVTVGTPDTQQVTLYRGPNGQRTLACAPQCQRTITQGDADMQAIQQDSEKKQDFSTKSAALGRH